MRKFSPKKVKPNNDAASTQLLKRMRRRVLWQAGLAMTVIVLTVVIVFAMTAAWSTNIVQTSGLQFQAQAWGFDGNITIGTGPIEAGPGDEGAVDLSVYNENQDIAAVKVSVTKSRMEDRMQKRLYFYVDAQQTKNDENMDRVYLNSMDSYTYTLLADQTLIMNNTYYNDAPLKWHWVYDVLGYYVLGRKYDDHTGVYETEWLRPVEYDYDDSTTVFDSEGKLISVDGVSVLDFLKTLSARDGYEGVVDEKTEQIVSCSYNADKTKRVDGVYYPVDVDDEGYGVYIYLYGYDEIQYAIYEDMALGEAALKASAEGTTLDPFVADIRVSAEDSRSRLIEVTTLEALRDALTDTEVDVIRLGSDITIPDGSLLEIPTGSRVTLDMNAKKIIAQATGTNTAIKLNEGSGLTMYRGEITGMGEGLAIHAVGAELAVRDVHVTGFNQGLRIQDNTGTGTDSNVRLTGCTIKTTDKNIMVMGNGSKSETKTLLVVDNCTITCDTVAISGSSNSSQWGTDIQIIRSTVTGNHNKLSAGISHPQRDSILTISDGSTVSGSTGIVIKGGAVSVTDSTVAGYGTFREPALKEGGFSYTGDAIYIETNYKFDTLLEISGTSIITTKYVDTHSVQVYKPDATWVTVKIYGGRFDEDVSQWVDSSSVQGVNDGKYVVAPKNTTTP